MQEEWHNTGWDPLEALLQCENNIQQCALAINRGSVLAKELTDQVKHQQAVIEQLSWATRRLQQQLDTLSRLQRSDQ